MKQSISMLVHGPSKTGKSTLSFTAPLPLLVLDAEGSTKFIRSAGFGSDQKVRKIEWDPMKEAPPRHDDSWDVCIVQVGDWMTIDMAYQHLQISGHDFKSCSVDSVTEVQRKCKANLRGDAQLQQQDWGALLAKMDKLIRGIRDLTNVSTNTLEAAIFIAETRMKDGKWRPYVQGALETSLPYWVDICGYVAQEAALDANGQSIGRSVNLIIASNDQYEAGERVQGCLPGAILDPHISTIIKHVYR